MPHRPGHLRGRNVPTDSRGRRHATYLLGNRTVVTSSEFAVIRKLAEQGLSRNAIRNHPEVRNGPDGRPIPYSNAAHTEMRSLGRSSAAAGRRSEETGRRVRDRRVRAPAAISTSGETRTVAAAVIRYTERGQTFERRHEIVAYSGEPGLDRRRIQAQLRDLVNATLHGDARYERQIVGQPRIVSVTAYRHDPTI